MRKLTGLVVWLLPVLTLSLRAEGPYVAPNAGPQVLTHVVQGSIVAVDSVFKRVTVQSSMGTQDFPIGTTTRVSYNFAQVPFQQLTPGDRVTVTYNVQPFYVTSIDKQ